MLQDFLQGTRSLLFPAACAACSDPLDRAAVPLCPSCLSHLPLLPAAACRRCALPLPGPGAGVEFCLTCRVRPPAFEQAVSPFLYDGSAKALVTALKFEGQLSLARFLGKRMARTVRERLRLEEAAPGASAHRLRLEEAAPRPSGQRLQGPGVQQVLPVPLHPVRQRERSFNQSALLARAVAEELGLPLQDNVIARRRFTRPQTELSREERLRNLRGAFVPGAHPAPRGAAVLLVDDVLTTGATADACARLLKKTGIRQVAVVTACRG